MSGVSHISHRASMATCQHQQPAWHPHAPSTVPTGPVRTNLHISPFRVVSPTSNLSHPVVSISPSSTTIPSYDLVCSKVGMPKCGRRTSKIRDLRIGEGGRSLPCHSRVAVDETQLERLESGASSRRCFSICEGVFLLMI